MRDGEGQSVGCIARWRRAERKEGAHHRRDLPLVGQAASRDRTFDASGLVLGDAETGSGQDQQSDATGMSQLGRGLCVLVEEERLHRTGIRTESFDDPQQLFLYVTEAASQRIGRRGMHDTVGDVHQTAPLSPNDPPAELSRAWVDAEYDHSPLLQRQRGCCQRNYGDGSDNAALGPFRAAALSAGEADVLRRAPMDHAAKRHELLGNQRHYLRGLAHSLKPVVQVGHAGVTQGVIAQIDAALYTHELIKVKLGEEPPAQRRTIATEIERAVRASAVQIVGRVLVLYRRRAHDPEIELPRARRSEPRARDDSGGQ
jgi:RNA-binding protein